MCTVKLKAQAGNRGFNGSVLGWGSIMPILTCYSQPPVCWPRAAFGMAE